MNYHCRRCGRFYRPLHPGDETCSHSCWGDMEAERERWDRFRVKNLEALEKLNDQHDDCDCLSCRPWTY
jgi:predicted nucleic acid-binding Zn ribbon protein